MRSLRMQPADAQSRQSCFFCLCCVFTFFAKYGPTSAKTCDDDAALLQPWHYVWYSCVLIDEPAREFQVMHKCIWIIILMPLDKNIHNRQTAVYSKVRKSICWFSTQYCKRRCIMEISGRNRLYVTALFLLCLLWLFLSNEMFIGVKSTSILLLPFSERSH